MEKLNETQLEAVTEFLANLKTEVDILNCLDVEDIDIENAYEFISGKIEDNNGFDIDIIFYFRAMEYLMENDTSLRDSLEIADEYGYEVSSLNSEVLASLLASRKARDRFYELRSEIEEFFQNLCDELEEEETT